MKSFDDFWNEITSDEIWFDNLKYRHGRKDIKGTAMHLHTNYVADGFIPEIKEARKHLNNKLIYVADGAPKVEKFEPKEDFNVNPLSDEQKANVDKLLNEYMGKIQGGMKRVPKMKREQYEVEGQERPKATHYPSTPESLVRQRELHNQWIKECFDPYTGEKNEFYLPEEQWLEYHKQVNG